MKRIWIISVLILAMAFIGIGCGKKDAQPGAAMPEAGLPAPAGVAENLGEKIGSSYVETLKQVVAMLDDRPAAADARAMLTDMKTWTIELMVDLGREREALSETDRATADRVLSRRIMEVPADLFKEYQAGQMHYKDDRELFQLIADFNIITQYANFDLLKKQLPEEARRLGIQ